MKVVISQPRYLPALGYLHRMAIADVFVYLDCVRYTPRDWENRNRIKTHDGWQWLSVPVVHTRREQRIHETRIAYDTDWPRKHLAALRHNYAAAPHFDAHYPGFEGILERRPERLIDLNLAVTDWLLASFGIACRFKTASSLEPAGIGAELLIDICRRLGATVYLSGPLGRDYIDEADFRRAGIELAYHEWRHPIYRQTGVEFLPNLSAIDLLFHEGAAGGRILTRGMEQGEPNASPGCRGPSG